MKIPNKIKAILPVRITYSTYSYHSLSIKKLRNGSYKRYYTCSRELCSYKIRKCLDKGFSTQNAAYFEVPENQVHLCRGPFVEVLDASSEEDDESEDDESEINSEGIY